MRVTVGEYCCCCTITGCTEVKVAVEGIIDAALLRVYLPSELPSGPGPGPYANCSVRMTLLVTSQHETMGLGMLF